MKVEKETPSFRNIVYSCYLSSNREGEQFVPQHTLSYQVSGLLTLNDGKNGYTSNEGTFRLIRRNQLLKFIKQPPENGEFKSLSIYLDQELLKNFSLEHKLTAEGNYNSPTVLQFAPDKVLKAYVDSLLSYREMNILDDKSLMELKLKEGIFILLQKDPSLKDILFDFTEPFKIDLEAFMNQNFHFNVSLDRFAYLTGRSLATFKRDFEKVFNSSPGRWLLQKRLQEAHYLIKEKGKTASDIYLDLGFEDLSHFSFAFKKAFGEAPSKVIS